MATILHWLVIRVERDGSESTVRRSATRPTDLDWDCYATPVYGWSS